MIRQLKLDGTQVIMIEREIQEFKSFRQSIFGSITTIAETFNHGDIA
jgi:hypothetical protein